MSVEQFTLQPSSIIGTIALIILLVTGVSVLLLAITTGRRAKTIRRTFFVLLVIGITVIGLGILLFFSSNTPSTITVGNGYVNIQSPSFDGAGNMNITANKIASAYVGQIGSGNLTLSNNMEPITATLTSGYLLLEMEKLRMLYPTILQIFVIQLTSGEYVILGTSNTNALSEGFAQFCSPH